MTHSELMVVGLIAVNVPTSVLWAKLVFGSWKRFWDAVGYWFTPDIVSLFRGRLLRDWEAEIKIGFWLFLSIGGFAGEYWLLQKLGII